MTTTASAIQVADSATRPQTSNDLGAGFHRPGGSPKGLAEIIETGRKIVEVLEETRRRAPPTRRGRRPVISFRHIADLGVFDMGASSMWRAAAIYRLAQQYPELYGYRHLGVAHLAAVLCLQGPLRLGVLRRAERLKWPRRRLQAQVKRILLEQAQGHDPLPEFASELAPQQPSSSAAYSFVERSTPLAPAHPARAEAAPHAMA